MSGGYNTVSDVDQYIPLMPIFVVPYLLGILFWIFTIIYINIKAKKKAAQFFNLVFVSAGILSVLIYVFVPTFVSRPEITNVDLFSTILNFVYANDKVYNAAPSGHTFYTIICFLGLNKLAPKLTLVWSIISILIISSTVLTKQHNILDIFFGIIFGFGLYAIVRVLNHKS